MFRAAVVASFAAVGCAGTCPPPETQCSSGVSFTMAQTEADTLGEGPATVKVCLGSSCTESAIGEAGTRFNGSSLSVDRLDAAQLDREDVTLTITREGTERFKRTWPRAKFEGQGTDPHCGDQCRVAFLNATTP